MTDLVSVKKSAVCDMCDEKTKNQITMSGTEQPKTLNDQLLEVAGTGDVEAVKKLLQQGASAKYEKYEPGTWGASHRESVIHAVLRKTYNKEILQILLENGADVNARYEDYNWKGGGSTLGLSKAFRENDPDLLQLLLKHGGNPNTPSEREAHTMRYDGRSISYPIHKAVNNGNVKFVRILLEHGADVNAVASDRGSSEYGSGSNTIETPIHVACALSKGADDVVDLLIKHGADVNAKAQYLDNLHVEIEGKDPDEWSDPREEGYVSNIVLVTVQQRAIHIALLRGNIRVAFRLLEAGADATVPWKHGDNTIETWQLGGAKTALAWGEFWSPQTHSHYPSNVKKVVKTLLLCNNRCKWNLSMDVFKSIIQQVIPDCMELVNVAHFVEEKKKKLKKKSPKLHSAKSKSKPSPSKTVTKINKTTPQPVTTPSPAQQPTKESAPKPSVKENKLKEKPAQEKQPNKSKVAPTVSAKKKTSSSTITVSSKTVTK